MVVQSKVEEGHVDVFEHLVRLGLGLELGLGLGPGLGLGLDELEHQSNPARLKGAEARADQPRPVDGLWW